MNASEIVILICGLILAFGAAGEYLEEHATLPAWMKWSRRPKMVFVWMVALSLVGEFLGDAGVFMFSGHLQSISDVEVAKLTKTASEADERSKTLDKSTQALKADAEKAHLETVKLRLAMADRHLTSEQRKTLVVALRAFVRHDGCKSPFRAPSDQCRITIKWDLRDAEGSELGKEVKSVIDEANLPTRTNEMGDSGDGIEIHASINPALAEQLFDLLSPMFPSVRRGSAFAPWTSWKDENTNQVIIIGRNPKTVQ